MVKRRIAEIRDIFAFRIEEQEAIKSLIEAIRMLVIPANAEQHSGLGKLLFALDRLPYKTPGLNVQISAEYDFTDFRETTALNFTEDAFEIKRTWISQTEWDESGCDTLFLVEPGRRWEPYEWEPDDGTIEALASTLGEPDVKIDAFDDSSRKFSFSIQPTPSDGWERLSNYFRKVDEEE